MYYLHCEQDFWIPPVNPEGYEGVGDFWALLHILNKFRKIPDIGYRGWDVHVVTIIILQFVVIKIVLKGRNKKNNYSETTVKTSEEGGGRCRNSLNLSWKIYGWWKAWNGSLQLNYKRVLSSLSPDWPETVLRLTWERKMNIVSSRTLFILKITVYSTVYSYNLLLGHIQKSRHHEQRSS